MSTGAGANGSKILELHDVHTYYGSIHALKGVSLEVRNGEISGMAIRRSSMPCNRPLTPTAPAGSGRRG